MDCKEIQPVHPKGNQFWVFIGGTDAEAETPILGSPHAKSWLIGKDPDAGRDWGQEEKGMTEDEMAGWHHPLDGHEFEWTPGVGDGQGGLACCDSWGRKELDMTERLNWPELMWVGGIRLVFSLRMGGFLFSPHSVTTKNHILAFLHKVVKNPVLSSSHFQTYTHLYCSNTISIWIWEG